MKVYLITYFAYALIHVQREFWSLSKPLITKEQPELTPTVLSRFDTLQLLTYGICLFIAGMLGDNYNQRIVLSIAFAVQSLFFLMLSFPGFFNFSY
jgi:sugar phosphate permease